MQWFDLIFLINLFCVWFSWRCAMQCFEWDNKKLAYLNLFASALNAAIVLDHFL